MAELTKKISSKIIKFTRLFFRAVLTIGAIGGIGILIGIIIYLNSQYPITYLIWVCLIVLGLGFVCYKHKKFFTKGNLKNVSKNTKLTAKKILKFSLYGILVIIGIGGIGVLFLIGGWVVSTLSATTIIIILLILILLK